MTFYGGNAYQTAAPGIYATNPGMMAAPMMSQQAGFPGGFQTMGTVAGDGATDSYADVFPQPQGSHAAAASRPSYEPLATSETHTAPRARDRAPAAPSQRFRIYSESRSRLCLLITCLLALVFPIVLLYTSMNARNDPSFILYNELSIADGSSDFATIMLILAVCAVVSMIVALFGVFVSGNESLAMVRCFVVSAVVVSFLLIIIGMYTFLANNSTEPTVVHTTNEICQAQTSTSASWGCANPAAGVAPTVVAASAPAATTHGGAQAWLASRNPAVSTTGCEELTFLCIAPINFAAESACSCSGQSAEAWVQTPTPSATGRLVGAYCHDWGNSTPATAGSSWCFVSQYVVCGEITLDIATGYLRSNGPCGDTVDSRSQAVYDGASWVQTACLWTAVVGLFLLIASWAGLWVYTSPESGSTQRTTRGLNPMDTQSSTRDDAARFDQAQRDAVSRITASTPERIKLEIYGYYKQAKDGDVTGSRPGMLSALDRKKYDAWARHRGMSREEAMTHYCSAVDIV